MKVKKIEYAARQLGRDLGAGTTSKYGGPNRPCLYREKVPLIIVGIESMAGGRKGNQVWH